MTDDVTPFTRFRAAKPRGGALSFDALSASIADAQKSTGFVDTKAQAPPSNDAPAPHSGHASAPGESDGGVENPPANGERPLTTAPDIAPSANAASNSPEHHERPVNQRKRERPCAVQCNLRLPRDIRDALHLQALRERRTIADMVSEVMRAYLEARGTFERLR